MRKRTRINRVTGEKIVPSGTPDKDIVNSLAELYDDLDYKTVEQQYYKAKKDFQSKAIKSAISLAREYLALKRLQIKFNLKTN